MANEWVDKDLPRAKGSMAPAIFDDEKQDWDVPRGRDGRQWTRDDSVESQLKILNNKMDELIEVMKNNN